MTTIQRDEGQRLTDILETLRSAAWNLGWNETPEGTDIVNDARQAILTELNKRSAESEERGKLKVTADLAWCLGKLRGLGHPNEVFEERYQLHPKPKKEEE